MKRLATLAAAGFLLLSLVGVCALPWQGRTLWERWREYRTGTIYYHGSPSARVVALTFDDGPDPRYTGRILDILKADHVRATFFVVGQRVEKYPDLARRIVREGHVLGNHTESHPALERERNPQVRDELEACEQRIERFAGERTYLFRPPRGMWNPTVFRDARADGYRLILWDLAFDRRAVRNPDVLGRRVIRLARPGDIILMHDGSASKLNERGSTTAELNAVIQGLRRHGFRFATVPELLHIRGNSPVSRTAERPLGLPRGRL